MITYYIFCYYLFVYIFGTMSSTFKNSFVFFFFYFESQAISQILNWLLIKSEILIFQNLWHEASLGKMLDEIKERKKSHLFQSHCSYCSKNVNNAIFYTGIMMFSHLNLVLVSSRLYNGRIIFTEVSDSLTLSASSDLPKELPWLCAVPALRWVGWRSWLRGGEVLLEWLGNWQGLEVLWKEQRLKQM